MKGQPLSRWCTRGVVLWRLPRLVGVEGAEAIAEANDPFILVANHSTRVEAILLPCLLAMMRGGCRVHFLADWNFALIPPVGLLYWLGETIVLTRKSAKPRFLNVFKPLFTSRATGFERARQRLEAGQSVGVFPEGTTNRRPDRLLRGYSGAAQLSLNTGLPLLPVGMVYPERDPAAQIRDQDPLRIRIGQPLYPDKAVTRPELAEVRAWHARMMQEIARLSGKHWRADAGRR
jgi:1-acyl-sn-glycerol-3-phosphate acyltransferase